MYNILVCDDEKDIVSAIKIYFEAEGYGVFTAENGKEALDIVAKEEIHLILMDVMMPVMDGIQAVRKLREDSIIPVIMLTAKSEDVDKVLGLGIARAKSQIRRYVRFGGAVEKPNDKLLVLDGLVLDDGAKEVQVDGEKVDLTPKEFEILKMLMLEKGRVFAPETIYRKVWGEEPYGSESTVAVHIRHLREKIEINPSEPRFIKVVWGQGYKVDRER